MSNSLRATLSSLGLVPSNDNPERILRAENSSFHAMYSYEHPKRAGTIKQEPLRTLYQVFASLKGKKLPPPFRSRAELDCIADILDVE